MSRGSDGGPGWWPGLVGYDAAINTEAFAILGVDYAADESGRTAPTTQEQAQVVLAAMDTADIASAAFVGASYGGMVALSLAAAHPERVRRLVVISADAAPHPMATAIRELRRVMTLGVANGCGKDALAVARGMAMLSYRTAEEFGERFAGGIEGASPLSLSAPGAYLHACGEAFVKRMSPERFLSLSASIDRHCVDPGAITAPVLLIGAEADQLVPPSQMRDLEARLAGPKQLHVRASRFGHDMFLKDAVDIGRLVGPFLIAA